MKDQALENSVITLHGKGWSIRRLSSELGISRERVRRILGINAGQRQEGNSPLPVKKKRKSKLDPYKEAIEEFLEKYNNATGQRVFEHIKQKGFDGGITILSDYLSGIRTTGQKEPIRLVETDPGQRAAHDWSDYNIKFTSSKDGESTQVTFFSYILSYSRRQYIEVVEDKTRKTLLRALINTFIYLDGVPREIKSDNQKACVDRWEAGRPVFNSKYLEFATHYRFRPLAIRPGRPQENLKIERPFWYLETSFLNAREFKDIYDLKQKLQRWLNEVNDVRIHGTTKRRPVDMYIEEQPYLQLLPAKHFDTSQVVHKVVNEESCIYWEGYQYVVPEKYMYELCSVRITDSHLIVYSTEGDQVISHELAEKGRKERYVGEKRKAGEKPDLSIADITSRLKAFGPPMNEYIQQVKRHKPSSWRHHLRSLLALKINYRVEDILVAVQRALDYKIFKSGAIENFLSVNCEPRYSMKLLFRNDKNNPGNE